jgi:hypothetical protein
VIGLRLATAHSNRVRRVFDAFLLFCYGAFIFWLSAQPNLSAPMWFSWHDKLYHGGAYFVLGVLVWRCFRHFNLNVRAQLLVCLAFSSVYGISDEWHQSFVPGRFPSAADWLADTAGAGLAAAALWLLPRIRRKLECGDNELK